MESGNGYPLRGARGAWHGEIVGPGNQMEAGAGALKLPFTLRRRGPKRAFLEIDGERYQLEQGEYSPWITLSFQAALGSGCAASPASSSLGPSRSFALYSTPINIDPEQPALPISHPACYAAYLAKLLGAYATLGLAEDTWALNERVIDEDAFLDQAWLIYDERERMFFSALDRAPHGVVACVFDTSDRMQHMFFRPEGPRRPATASAIEDLYVATTMVGRTMQVVDDSTAVRALRPRLRQFDRGVNLNAWLLEHGYLALQEGATGRKYFKAIDWGRTRAYASGWPACTSTGRAARRRASSSRAKGRRSKRRSLRSSPACVTSDADELAIRKAWPSRALYKGPYLDAAPDLIVGYNKGYRPRGTPLWA